MLQIVRALKTQAVQRRQAEGDYQVQVDDDTLSIRLPPGADPEEVKELFRQALDQLY